MHKNAATCVLCCACLLLKAHLEGDMDSPQHTCHLPQGCRQLIHLLVGKDTAAVTALTRAQSDQHLILQTLQLHIQMRGCWQDVI